MVDAYRLRPVKDTIICKLYIKQPIKSIICIKVFFKTVMWIQQIKALNQAESLMLK